MGDWPDNTSYPTSSGVTAGGKDTVIHPREGVIDLGVVDGEQTFEVRINYFGPAPAEVPPPNSPAGGGGRGYFTSRRPAGDTSTLDLHHFTGVADNYEDDPDGFFAALDGVRCVLAARDRAILYAPAAVFEMTGMALAAVLEGLLPGLALCAVVVGLTTAAGAGIGFLLGLLEGVVGALPGAVIGGELGFDAGMYILSWLGVGFLIKGIGESLAEAVGLMRDGAALAWRGRGREEAYREFFIEAGAHEMAKGLAVVVRALLEGVVLYVTGRGAFAATERLAANVERLGDGANRAAMAAERLNLQKARLDDLLGRLRENNLLRPFANWIQNHVDDLVNNPKLRGKQALPLEEPPPLAEPPPAQNKPAPKEEPPPEEAPQKKTNSEKGVIGEAAGDEYMTGRGMKKLNGDPVKVGDDPLGPGIDGVWENPKPPPDYIISETKYGSSKLGYTKDGRQMSDKWIDRRLDKAVGKAQADKIRDAQLEGRVEKWLLHVDEAGNVTQRTLK
jgi:hypothetical protein